MTNNKTKVNYSPFLNFNLTTENELLHLSWDAQETRNGWLKKRIEQRKNELEKYDY